MDAATQRYDNDRPLQMLILSRPLSRLADTFSMSVKPIAMEPPAF